MSLFSIGDKFGVNAANDMRKLGYGNVTAGGTNEVRIKVSTGGAPSRDLTYWTGAAWANVNAVPAGMIALFDTACPDGWTRFSALDGLFPRGAAAYGGTGTGSHTHKVNPPSTYAEESGGGHTHTFSVTTGAPSATNTPTLGGTFPECGTEDHTHSGSGTTAGTKAGMWVDIAEFDSGSAIATPPYLDMVYCKKNALA